MWLVYCFSISALYHMAIGNGDNYYLHAVTVDKNQYDFYIPLNTYKY